MKKETIDMVFSLIMTFLICGVVYQIIYLKTHVFDFTFIDFFFVLFVYEVISIKRMLKRTAENALNYATYLKIYMDVKFGGITTDNLKEYFENLKKELEKQNNA